MVVFNDCVCVPNEKLIEIRQCRKDVSLLFWSRVESKFRYLGTKIEHYEIAKAKIQITFLSCSQVDCYIYPFFHFSGWL